MALTPAQLTTLKAAILADGTLNAYPNTIDGAFDMAAQKLNQVASPVFTVWKTNVPIASVGVGFSGTELAGMTTGNQTRLQTIGVYFPTGVNPSIVDVRQMFDDIFSGAGGATTRANLAAIWRRPAKMIEKIFASGTGSDAVPATMTWEGGIGYQDVLDARNS